MIKGLKYVFDIMLESKSYIKSRLARSRICMGTEITEPQIWVDGSVGKALASQV